MLVGAFFFSLPGVFTAGETHYIIFGCFVPALALPADKTPLGQLVAGVLYA